MSGRGNSTPTKPMPAPRRGSKPKEPSASVEIVEFQNTVRQFYEWMDTLGNVFVAPTRKEETLPKLANLLKNELFVVLEEEESFSTRVCSPAEQRLETGLRCFLKLEKS